jgi:membrane fusion protein (multidrug efflux system)
MTKNPTSIDNNSSHPRQSTPATRPLHRIRLHHNAGKVGLTLAIVVVCIAAYPVYSLFYSTTNDAQVDGHIYPVNSRVNGTVKWVNPEVEDTRYVEAGTVLARLDPDDYTPAVDKLQGDVQDKQAQLSTSKLELEITKPTAQSRLQGAKAAVAEVTAELASSQADEQSAQAQLSQARASYSLAEANRRRYESLVKTHEISNSEYDERATSSTTAHEQVAIATASLKVAQTRIEALRQKLLQRKSELSAASVAPQTIDAAASHIQQVNGQLQESLAELREAQLNLGYTTIVAPVSGIIGQRQMEAGQRVQTGQLMVSVVPTNDLWITAYFRETQMRRMRVGQKASFKIDTYGQKLHGHIESIGGATGSKYSLLPPENSTGNFVKVVQRVPVRLHIDDAIDPGKPILPGMSVEVYVQLEM